MKKIKYVSLCSGYGAECIALKRLKRDYPEFDFECLAWSEIELNAIKAHNAIHPEYAERNLGDMTTANYLQIAENNDCDLLFYSTPCQSVSRAGKRKGMKKDDDAASALIWHTERAIKELKPRICILENVPGMVEKRNIEDFKSWCRVLEGLGYVNFWRTLNAKNFGVPQNRERVFMVSILKDGATPYPYFTFPTGWELDKCVEDYMEPAEGVSENYYICKDRITREAISDMLNQPNVYDELLKIYHDERKEADCH